MQLLDPDDPFFRRFWVRVAVVVFCLAWAVVELMWGTRLWAALFGGIGLWAGWLLFLAPKSKGKDKDG